jgi:hypothetical protein
MIYRISAAIGVLGLVAAAYPAATQDIANAGQMPSPQQMQLQVQQIAQQRPREAEAAARGFIHLMSQQPGMFRAEDRIAELDQLKAAMPDAYWSEVAQLTVQFDVVQNLVRRDSVRAQLVTVLFGLEAMARTLQRAYRGAPEAQRATYRSQLEKIIGNHFDVENQLRTIEIKDIERRLADVRAETQRRLDKRAEFVRFAVDDIIRDAIRPR